MRRHARGRRRRGQGFPLAIRRIVAVLGALGASAATAAEPPPLALASGFRIELVADGLGAPRMLALDSSGALLVSIPSQGRIVALPAARRPERLRSPVTVNERDWRNGGAPPDFLALVREGADYGWPDCYARGGALAPDPEFRGASDCRDLTLPSVELAPHAAPLGLAFYTGTQFPPAYRGS